MNPLQSLRDYLWLATAVAVALALLWWHHATYQAGIASERGRGAQALAQQAIKNTLREKALTDQLNAAEVTHANELDNLNRQRAAVPVRVVRVYLPAPARTDAVPSDSHAKPATAGATPAAGVLPQAPGFGPDIGAALYSDADRCDELSAQVRALLAARATQ